MRMKKLFTLASLLAFALATPVMAQDEEDVTYYIQNAGFDEDLTFQADGTMKEAISTETSLSDRSWAYIAADSTLYARPKATSSQNRPDGRKLEAVNGFIGRIKGWTVETSAAFPGCEWVYFGSVPYDLGAEAVPTSDDTNGFLFVPERPTEFFGDENNVGAAYLRAGWGGSCVYKQDVKLPCAVYRIEYWAYNCNANSSATPENLTKVTCRKDVFVDEGGLNEKEWTKHSFEFTPVDKFTLQFGFKSANSSSNNNPWILIDGIKLYKIDDADPLDLLREDLNDIYNTIFTSLDTICVNADGEVFQGLISEAQNIADDEYNESSVEEIQVSIAALQKAYADAVAAAAVANRVALRLQFAEKLLNGTDYPGKDALNSVVESLSSELYGDEIKAADVAAAEDALTEAINAYYFSQVAKEDAAADYSFLIQNPWFCVSGREPISNNVADLVEAAMTTDDKTAEGWENGSTASGDPQTGAYFKVGRPCYQLWSLNFTGYLDMHQTLTNLPNGIYSLEADLITNTDALGDQHIYAHSALGEAEGYMTEAGVLMDWPSGDYEFTYDEYTDDPWETVKTTTTVIVNDGTLTIGARSTHKGEGEDYSSGQRRGVFWMSNFVLRYYGEATEAQIAEAKQARASLAESLKDALHFNADKPVVADSIAKYHQTGDLAVLNGGIEFARTSEAKYDEIMEDGKTIPTVKANIEEAPEEYGVGLDIVKHALQATEAWIASAEASYKDVDARLQLMKNYVNTYVPALIEANDTRSTIFFSKSAKQALDDVMAKQKAALTQGSLVSAEVINQYVEELKMTAKMALAQEDYEQNVNATDYTNFIMNPDLAEETGWTFEKGEGDANSKSGQHYSGDGNRRYIDSYNSTAGKLNYYAEQVIQGLPNGTYEVKAAVRTSAVGAFLFTANGIEKADTVFTEIPLQEYTYFDEEQQKDTTVFATTQYGAIWQEAYYEYIENGNGDFFEVYNVNNATGYGWEWLTLPAVEVKNHTLTIGATTDGARTGKAFEGTWFSATDFSLTLLQKGNNDDWNGPITSVTELRNAATAKTVYSIDGRRVSNTNRPGLYIITENGRTRKVVTR